MKTILILIILLISCKLQAQKVDTFTTPSIEAVKGEYKIQIWYPSSQGQLLYAANVLTRKHVPRKYRRMAPAGWDQQQWKLMIKQEWSKRLLFATTMLLREATIFRNTISK